MEKTNREGFASNFGFIMAAVGSAVGLGNIWGFPYKMGMNGGFAFLLIYLVLAIFIGIAVMIGELVIGRKTGLSPIAAYRKLSKKFTFLGYMALACPFLILCFYFVLGGMVMRYALSYLTAIFGWNVEPLQADFLGVLKAAAGQMFFSLSLGMGAMITYGSYLQKKESIQKNAVIVVICDTLVAIMAGMIVMPACYAFLGGNTTGGPGLLFASMQQVFHNMGYIGNIMGFLFYTLVFIAAISSSMSLLEVITSFKVDQNVAEGKAPGRKKYAIIAAVIIFVFCLPTCLDGLGNGLANGAAIGTPAEILGVDVKGWNCDWLDFYDMLSEGIMMPLGAMVMAFAIGWIWKLDMIVEECESSGHKFWGKVFFEICYKFITPIGMAFVLYAQVLTFFG